METAAATLNLALENAPQAPGYNTSLVGMPGNGGFTVQPFIPAASGLPSRLSIAGGNMHWDMTVLFEIWCDGQLAASKMVNTAGDDHYSHLGGVFNLSFADVANRRPVQAGKPCELHIQTTKTSISYTAFGVQVHMVPPLVGKFGSVALQGYPHVRDHHLAMALMVG